MWLPHTFLFTGASFLILRLERETFQKLSCEFLLCCSYTGSFLGPRVKSSVKMSPRKTNFLSLLTLGYNFSERLLFLLIGVYNSGPWLNITWDFENHEVCKSHKTCLKIPRHSSIYYLGRLGLFLKQEFLEKTFVKVLDVMCKEHLWVIFVGELKERDNFIYVTWIASVNSHLWKDSEPELILSRKVRALRDQKDLSSSEFWKC